MGLKLLRRSLRSLPPALQLGFTSFREDRTLNRRGAQMFPHKGAALQGDMTGFLTLGCARYRLSCLSGTKAKGSTVTSTPFDSVRSPLLCEGLTESIKTKPGAMRKWPSRSSQKPSDSTQLIGPTLTFALTSHDRPRY